MKAIYINPFDGSGYGVAGTQMALALDSVGVDVVCRRLDLGGNYGALHPRIAELERKSAEGCTHVIQHSLPSHFQYDGRLRCVGMFAWETDKMPPHWVRRLNQMDAVWVVNPEQAQTCKTSGVRPLVSVVPHPCDLSRYQDPEGPLLSSLVPYKEKGDFLFYAVGEWVRRKHWSALIRAFHGEFLPGESVQLIVKTSCPGLSPQDAQKKVREGLSDMKRAMRLSRAKEEIVITDFLTDEQMLALHRAGDCHVSTSFGEAFSLGTFDAMALGKPVIAPDSGGFSSYLDDSCAWLVPGRMEPAFGAVEAPPHLYSHEENWFSVDILALQKAMREAYENRSLSQQKGENGRRRASAFSWEKMGTLMKGLLAQVRP